MQKITQLKQTQGPSRQAAARLAMRTHLRAGKDCGKVYEQAYENCIALGIPEDSCDILANKPFYKCAQGKKTLSD